MGNIILADGETLDFINLDKIMWEGDGQGPQTLSISTVATLSLSGKIPTCSITVVYVPKASVIVAGYTPTAQMTSKVDGPVAGILLTGYAPEQGSFVSAEITTVGHIVLTGYTPSMEGGTVVVPMAHAVITGYAPGNGVAQIPVPIGHLTLTGYSPTYMMLANIPPASISLAGYGPLFGPSGVIVPVTGLTLTGYPPTYFQIIDVPKAAGIALAGYAPGFGAVAVSVPLASGLEIAAYSPAVSWSLSASVRYKVQTIYLCLLTGSADGLTDLTIPISSFQSTMRDGDPSYLACVIPNSVAYVTDIIARTNGDIVIRKGYRLDDGSAQTEEIIRVDYESLQIARGANNDSATISGHKTTSSSNPKTVTLNDVSYYGLQTDGKRTYRALPDLFLRVGDTAVYGAESIIVGQISYIVDAQLAIMQVTEA